MNERLSFLIGQVMMWSTIVAIFWIWMDIKSYKDGELRICLLWLFGSILWLLLPATLIFDYSFITQGSNKDSFGWFRIILMTPLLLASIKLRMYMKRKFSI